MKYKLKKKLLTPILGISFLLSLALFQNATTSPSSIPETEYFKFTTKPENWTNTPLDFGYLNGGPVTKFITIDGDKFIASDTTTKTPIKFFGVNLVYSANFPDTPGAIKLADGLKNMGVNIVRIMSLDHYFADDPNFSYDNTKRYIRPGIINQDGTLNYTSIIRLRNLISLLKERGIYIDLTLHTANKIGFGTYERFHKDPFHIIDGGAITQQKQYACNLIQQLNLYNNPVLAMVEINNESSLVDAWQEGRLDDINPGDAYYPELTNPLAGKTGDNPSAYIYLNNPSVTCTIGAIPKFNGGGTAEERRCFVKHLTNLDQKYLDELRTNIKSCARKSSAPQVSVTGTQMAMGGLANRISHANMDFIDTHSYIDHPSSFNFGAQFNNRSMVEDGFFPLESVALLRDPKKPFTISEFNQSWPNEYGHEASLNFSAFGVLQNWNALMQFNYMNSDEFDQNYPRGLVKNSTQQAASGFNLYGDPSRLAGFAQASKLFRTMDLNNVPSETMNYLSNDALNIAQFMNLQNGKAVSHKQFNILFDTRSLSQSYATKSQNGLLNSRLSSNVIESGARSLTSLPVAKAQDNILFNSIELGNQKKGLFINSNDTVAINCKPGEVKDYYGLVLPYAACGSPQLELRYPFGQASFLATVILSKLSGVNEYLLTIPGSSYRILKRKDNVSGLFGIGKAALFLERLISKNNDGKYKLINPDESAVSSWDMTKYEQDSVVLKRPKATVRIKFYNLPVGQDVTIYLLNGNGQKQCYIPSKIGPYNVLNINLAPMEHRISPWYHIIASKPLSGFPDVKPCTIADASSVAVAPIF